jgi:hypothetical protein
MRCRQISFDLDIAELGLPMTAVEDHVTPRSNFPPRFALAPVPRVGRPVPRLPWRSPPPGAWRFWLVVAAPPCSLLGTLLGASVRIRTCTDGPKGRSPRTTDPLSLTGRLSGRSLAITVGNQTSATGQTALYRLDLNADSGARSGTGRTAWTNRMALRGRCICPARAQPKR